MEVHSLPATAGEEVTVEEQMTSSVRYLRVTSGHYREIIAGGLYADDLTLPVREQSEQVFGKAEEILKAEQMNFGDIVQLTGSKETSEGIEWQQVAAPNGVVGWVSARFLETINP